MKKEILMAIAIIGILGSCATLAVATPATIGEMKYYNTQDNFLINGSIQGNVDLTLAYSEVNASGIIIEKMWYDSTTNKTTYKFTTQKTQVDWWFTPCIKKFIFVDGNTNNLYQLNVNYDNITIPENPYTKQQRELEENYTMILNDYNLTNSSLANITLLYNELNALYNLTEQQFNATKTNQSITAEELKNKTAAYITLNDDYNATYALWEVAVDNVSTYQIALDGLHGDYNKVEKDRDDLAGSIPWYVFITFLGTLLFTYFYLRRKTIFEQQPQVTDEITTNYGRIHAAIDKYILSRLRYQSEEKTIEKNPEEKGSIEEVPEWKPVTNEEKTVDSEKKEVHDQSQDDILTMVHEKIDANNRAMTKQVTELITGLDEKIDKLVGKQ